MVTWFFFSLVHKRVLWGQEPEERRKEDAPSLTLNETVFYFALGFFSLFCLLHCRLSKRVHLSLSCIAHVCSHSTLCFEKNLNSFSLFSFVCVLLACVYAHAWCLWRSEEGIRSQKLQLLMLCTTL